MNIRTRVLDAQLNTIFKSETKINPRALIEIAKPREDMARSKGVDWTRNAIPFFGKELIDVAKSGNLGKAIDKAAMEVALAAWVFDSVYCGLNAEEFLKCDLEFTKSDEGIVRYDRNPSRVASSALH